MQPAEKLSVFLELIHCTAPISFWHYDREMNLISSDSSQPELFDMLFNIGDCRQIMFAHCLQSSDPAILSNQFHMTWICAPLKVENVLTDIYVLGPTFHTIISESNFGQAIGAASVGLPLKAAARRIMHDIPVVSYSNMSVYACQLYYCLYGKQRHPSDIWILGPKPKESLPLNNDHSVPRHTPYSFELEFFRIVEEGDINFSFSPEDPLLGYEVGRLAVDDPLRQAKNEVLVSITLTCRAAMRGGMNEEAAYSLSDYYFQAVESAATVSEAYQYSAECYRDFTYRVHQHKLSRYSKEISGCISYIQMHLDEKISLETVAESQGFNKNYLSSRFKKETGQTMGDYIAKAKTDRAKFLLDHTDLPVSEISHQLCYSSESHFGSSFRKMTDMTPTEYRNRRHTSQ